MPALVGALLVLGLGCHRGSRDASAVAEPLPRSWHYEVSVNAELSRVDTTVCFHGPPPRELRAGKDGAAGRLTYARWVSPGSVHRLRVVDGRVQLDATEDEACIAYGVTLAEGDGLGSVVRRVGRDVLASPNAWLWRPERRAADAVATLRLSLPDGLRASLPWPVARGLHTLHADAFGFDSYAAFGRFRPFTVRQGETRLEVAVLDGTLAVDQAAITRWLMRSVTIASGVDGTFPCPRAQILIVPVGAVGDPVAFGTVARGGAGSIMLFVSADASEPALTRDWVLPHELSHLLLPYIARGQAWLPEGLATYYQEVLRARGGVISERDTLRNLAEALDSASREGTGRSLSDESAAMYQTYAFRAVYWGGAAYFLRADVELRRRTKGLHSLDTVLTTLRERHDAHTRIWRAEELLAELDRIAGARVFVPLAAQEVRRPFPNYAATLAALGICDAGRRLDDTAPLVAIRRAIFGPRAAGRERHGARARRVEIRPPP